MQICTIFDILGITCNSLFRLAAEQEKKRRNQELKDALEANEKKMLEVKKLMDLKF